MYCSLSVCLPDYLDCQPAFLSVYQPACMRACLPVSLSVCFVFRYTYYLSVFVSACLSLRLLACLCACLPTYLPARLSVCQPVCMPVCLLVCPACLSVSQSVASILTLKCPCLPSNEPRDDGSSVIHTQILGSGRILRLQHRLAHAQHALQDCVAHDFR